MLSLDNALRGCIERIDPEIAKQMKIADNNARFVQAVRMTWKDSDIAAFILSHINAFYVRKEKVIQKGSCDPVDHIVIDLYVDETFTRSEIKVNQEILKLSMESVGFSYDELSLKASRGSMKQRHPFFDFLSEDTNDSSFCSKRELIRHIGRSELIENLQTVKRAFCLVFGEHADRVLSKIASAELVLINDDDMDKKTKRSNRYGYWLNVYVRPENLLKMHNILRVRQKAIQSKAWHLGLQVRSIKVFEVPSALMDEVAFPVVGEPVIMAEALHNSSR